MNINPQKLFAAAGILGGLIGTAVALWNHEVAQAVESCGVAAFATLWAFKL